MPSQDWEQTSASSSSYLFLVLCALVYKHFRWIKLVFWWTGAQNLRTGVLITSYRMAGQDSNLTMWPWIWMNFMHVHKTPPILHQWVKVSSVLSSVLALVKNSWGGYHWLRWMIIWPWLPTEGCCDTVTTPLSLPSCISASLMGPNKVPSNLPCRRFSKSLRIAQLCAEASYGGREGTRPSQIHYPWKEGFAIGF